MKTTTTQPPAIVTPIEWLAARRELLQQEKQITRLQDELGARRRALPWVKVAKQYRFDSESGPVTLADLFAGRSQLIVQHFMFGRDWEEGCKSCSFMMDHFVATTVHLAARDVAFAAVSRGAAGRDSAFQAPHGLAGELGVGARQRLQHRLSRVVLPRGSRGR